MGSLNSFRFENMTSTSYFLAHTFSIVLLTLIVKSFISYSSITDALAFYGVYHRNPINQLIHFVGVPASVWSMMIIQSHLNVPLISFTVNIPGTSPHKATYSTLIFAIYTLCYLYLDPYGGLFFFPFIYVLYITSTSLTLKDKKEAKLQKGNGANAKPSSTVSWTGTG